MGKGADEVISDRKIFVQRRTCKRTRLTVLWCGVEVLWDSG